MLKSYIVQTTQVEEHGEVRDALIFSFPDPLVVCMVTGQLIARRIQFQLAPHTCCEGIDVLVTAEHGKELVDIASAFGVTSFDPAEDEPASVNLMPPAGGVQ